MAKDYENPALRKYLNNQIKKMKIDNKFKPLIVEILMRRAHQYTLSPKEIQTDVYRVVNNLYSISNISKEEGSKVSWAGVYIPTKKSIKINPLFRKSNEDLFETLTHEVYHALSKDPKTMMDLVGGFNTITKQYNHSMLETIIEKAAYKTVYGTIPNNLYYNNNASGYSNLTFVLDAIEATYGVREQALLRNSIQTRGRLIKFLASSCGEKEEETENFLNSLEANFAVLHKTLYKNKEGKDLNAEFVESFKMMKILCDKKLSERIENTKINKDFSDEVIENLKFDSNKLNTIFSSKSIEFSKYPPLWRIRSSYRQDEKVIASNAQKVKRIVDMESVFLKKDNLDSETYEMLLNWAKYGNLDNFDKKTEMMKLCGIENTKSLGDYEIVPANAENFDFNENLKLVTHKDNYKIIPGDIAVKHVDNFQFTESWDNSNISQLIEKAFKESTSEKIKNTIQNLLSKLKNGNAPSLPEASFPQENNNNIENTNSWKIDYEITHPNVDEQQYIAEQKKNDENNIKKAEDDEKEP